MKNRVKTRAFILERVLFSKGKAGKTFERRNKENFKQTLRSEERTNKKNKEQVTFFRLLCNVN